jgi:hypothetical protein
MADSSIHYQQIGPRAGRLRKGRTVDNNLTDLREGNKNVRRDLLMTIPGERVSTRPMATTFADDTILQDIVAL